MKWSIHELSELGKPVSVDRKLSLSRTLQSRDAKMILSARVAHVKASVKYVFGRVIMKARVRIAIVVPSSRSLTPVRLPMNFRFREVYVTSQYDLKRYEREHPHGDTVLLVKPEGYIDLKRAVVDNIILQIPPKVLSNKEKRDHLMPKGKGWQVISEDDYHQSKTESHQVDPRLAKLKDYFSKK